MKQWSRTRMDGENSAARPALFRFGCQKFDYQSSPKPTSSEHHKQKFGCPECMAYRIVSKTGVIDKELGKFYSDIFDMRQTGDYEDFIDFGKEDVMDLIEPANNLINKIESLLLN